jgi:hypothetical protein
VLDSSALKAFALDHLGQQLHLLRLLVQSD